MKKIDWTQILIIIFTAIIVAGVLTVGAMSIYCWCAYGGKPASEIPAWALWFMFGGR